MPFAVFLTLLGAFFLFRNNGWSFDFDLSSIGTIWPLLALLLGLVILLKRRY